MTVSLQPTINPNFNHPPDGAPIFKPGTINQIHAPDSSKPIASDSSLSDFFLRLGKHP